MPRSIKRRAERPKWVDELIEGRETEWKIYDSETQETKTKYARTQKEAIKLGISMNVVPRRTHDVIPLNSGNTERLMKPTEFNQFMNQIRAE